MLDLILLVIFSLRIHAKAQQIGEPAWTWVFRLVFFFLSAEIPGLVLVMYYLDIATYWYVAFLIIIPPVLAAKFVFSQLEKIESQKNFENIQNSHKPNLDHFR
jgi:hypothetical protein